MVLRVVGFCLLACLTACSKEGRYVPMSGVGGGATVLDTRTGELFRIKTQARYGPRPTLTAADSASVLAFIEQGADPGLAWSTAQMDFPVGRDTIWVRVAPPVR